MSKTPISPLRRRMIEDMSLRRFGEQTQNDYIRRVKNFSTLFLLGGATSPLDLLTPFSSKTDT
jgi:hypothetical protein